MRFLIVSAVLACASAAPSHLIAPGLAYAGLPAVSAFPAVSALRAVPALTPVAYSAAIPTISPGDVQAAFIDAQVKAQDLAIAQVDKARALLEQNSEVISEKVFTGNDQIKENYEEAFWAAQDKQWQALDALNTAEAQIQGAVASNAPELVKSVAPVVYTPGVVASAVKAVEIEAKAEEAKPEEKKEEEKKEEKKEEEKKEEEKKEEEKKEEPTPKAAESKEEKESAAVETSTLAPVVASLSLSYPVVAPIARVGPIGLTYNAYPQFGFAPTIVKSVW